MLGIPAYIVVPNNVPACKMENVNRYGGQITLCKPTLESRGKEAARIQQETGAVLIHSYNDPRIIRCLFTPLGGTLYIMFENHVRS
jgi:serine racemase